jgi:hypothetical protein
LMLLFLQASIAHYFSKLKAIKPMNKGKKVAPKKTVSVAASAPLLPRGEQYTPCEAKRRHMAGITPYHPSAYSSILAGSDSDDAHAEEQEEDVYALVDAARNEFTPPKKKARKGAGRPCHMYIQVGRYGGVVMWKIRWSKNCRLLCYAMHRAARTQRTSSSNVPTVSSGFDHNDVDEKDNFAAQVDTSSPLDSGLTESQRLSCLLHDSEGRILKMASCLY